MADISKMADSRDRGYAWVALAAMFFLNVLHSASFATLGIFIVEFLAYFETSKTKITWIGAIQMFLGNIASILSGPILKKFGCRAVLTASSLMICVSFVICGLFDNLPVLYAFFGVFSGIGYIFMYIGGLVSIQHWFNKRRSLASGIFMTGLSAGTFIWPPLTRWLIDLYSWQGAFIVMAAILLNGIVSAGLLRKVPETVTKNATNESKVKNIDDNENNIFSLAALRENIQVVAPFALFLLGVLGEQMGHMNMYVYTPVRAQELNFEKHESPLLISVIGIVGLVCRPIAGWIADKPQINRTIMFGLSVTLVGALEMLSTQFSSFPLLLTVSVAFGIFSGGYIGIMGAVLVDIAGLANLEVATGIFIATLGVGNVLLHPIAGTILDLTGSSNILFWVFGSAQLIGGILIMMVPLVKRNCSKPSNRNYGIDDQEISHKNSDEGCLSINDNESYSIFIFEVFFTAHKHLIVSDINRISNCIPKPNFSYSGPCIIRPPLQRS